MFCKKEYLKNDRIATTATIPIDAVNILFDLPLIEISLLRRYPSRKIIEAIKSKKNKEETVNLGKAKSIQTLQKKRKKSLALRLKLNNLNRITIGMKNNQNFGLK